MRKSRKTKSQQLINKCDKVWADTIKERAEWRCEKCGRGKFKDAVILNAAHIVRRANKEVRWELGNGLSLCVRDHYWFDNSTNRLEVIEWLEEKLGKGFLSSLLERSRISLQWLVRDLENKLAELESFSMVKLYI